MDGVGLVAERRQDVERVPFATESRTGARLGVSRSVDVEMTTAGRRLRNRGPVIV